jgi:diacylglycerol kinase
VFAAEAFNTAIEVLTDLVTPEYNNKAKIVKDVSAAGVLIAAITAVAIGVVVFRGGFQRRDLEIMRSNS